MAAGVPAPLCRLARGASTSITRSRPRPRAEQDWSLWPGPEPHSPGPGPTPPLAASLEAGPWGHTAPLSPPAPCFSPNSFSQTPQCPWPRQETHLRHRPGACGWPRPLPPQTRLTLAHGPRACLMALPVCRGHQTACWRPHHRACRLLGTWTSQHKMCGLRQVCSGRDSWGGQHSPDETGPGRCPAGGLAAVSPGGTLPHQGPPTPTQD